MNNPQVTLREIPLSGILARDPPLVADLAEACTLDGCFYLNLQDPYNKTPWSDACKKAEQLYEIADEFFQLPLEQKLSWEMDKWGDMQIGGYKPTGKHSGVSNGTRDGFENFLVPLNALLHLDSIPSNWPQPISARLPLIHDFELMCHNIARALLTALWDSIPVKPKIPFQDLHREQQKSTTSLAMLKYPPCASLSRNQIGHMPHTDVGSLTLLFTSSPGLEVFFHNDSWIPVCPGPGRIVVNVGDTLNFMSGQQLKSCLHRVVPHVDTAGFSRPRFSLAFFLRPELSARFVDGQGKEWTGDEWHRTKYRIFRADDEEQSKTSLLTGKRGFLGKWQDVVR